jgi:nicotinamidase-related amidase
MTASNWRSYLPGMPTVAASFTLDPERAALLIVDMQYACAGREYQLGKYYAATRPDVGQRYFDIVEQIVLPNQQRLLAFFREHALRVIYLTVGSELPDASDLGPQIRARDAVVGGATGARPQVWRNSFERQIMAPVAPREGELVVNKLSKGAFNSSNLDRLLRNFGIQHLVVAGVATNACVALTAQDAADRGYGVVIVDDACASNSQVLHESTLANFYHLYGRVHVTEEVLQELTDTLEGTATSPSLIGAGTR